MLCGLCLDQSGNHFVDNSLDAKEKQALVQLILEFLKLEPPTNSSFVLCPDCDESISEFHKFCLQTKQQRRSKVYIQSSSGENEQIKIKAESLDEYDIPLYSGTDNVRNIPTTSGERASLHTETSKNKRKSNTGSLATEQEKQLLSKRTKTSHKGNEAPQQTEQIVHVDSQKITELSSNTVFLQVEKQEEFLVENDELKNDQLSVEESIDSDGTEFNEANNDDIKLNDDQLVAKYVRLNCDICSEEKSTLDDLIKHFKVSHNIDNGYAVCCDKRYSRIHFPILLTHIKKHQNPETYNELGDTRNFRRAAKLYRRKRPRTDPGTKLANVQNALTVVVVGSISISKAARMYNVDRKLLSVKHSELKRRCGGVPNIEEIHNISVGYSKKTKVFTLEQESQLFGYLSEVSRIFFGISKQHMRKMAFQYAEECEVEPPTGWNQRCAAGEDWMIFYLNRHPTLSLRFNRNNKLYPYTGFNKINVTKYFWNIKSLIDGNKFTAASIWNIEEIGINTATKGSRVIERQALKKTTHLNKMEREQIVAVTIGISAEGNSMPPFFIFATRTQADKAPIEKSERDISTEVWMGEEQFYEFAQHFVQHVKSSEKNPALLIIGEHESYLSIKTMGYLKRNWVTVQSFPPGCSHKLQPLEQNVFQDFKQTFASKTTQWLQDNRSNGMLRTHDIPEFLKDFLKQTCSVTNIKSSFQKTGLYPLKPDVFSETDFTPIGENGETIFAVDNPVAKRKYTKRQNTFSMESKAHNKFLEKAKRKYNKKQKLSPKELKSHQKLIKNVTVPVEKSSSNLFAATTPSEVSTDNCNFVPQFDQDQLLQTAESSVKRSKRERKRNSFYDIFEKF